jgi:D-serine dehydratase
MPYNIEHNKNGTYSVVNKESGKRLSKGTTKNKAEKQIKAIYVNGGKMKPEHEIRYFT